MPRSIIALVVAVVVLIAGVWLLAGRDTHKEPARIDKEVSLENLAN